MPHSAILDNVNPDLSDSEFDIDSKPRVQDGDVDGFYDGAATPDPGAATPGGGQLDDGMDYEDPEVEGEGEDDDEDDLAAELERALAGEEESGEDDEDEEEEEDETEDEVDEDEDAELTQGPYRLCLPNRTVALSVPCFTARRLLEEEIQDLEAAVEKKVTEIARSGNPLIKVSPRYDLLQHCRS